nr:MAG TPA: hypothetical protein [Caudoviricetes sp.]
MKVELQCGDTITIPAGCKAIVKDGCVVFEKEEKFKDGDILTLLRNNKIVFIFKEDELKQKDNRNGYYVCHTADYVIDVPTKGSLFFCGHKKDVRLATEDEKQFLFDKMKEQGLRWNAEEKRVEKIRWRAKKYEKYYFFDANLLVRSIDDTYSTFDNELWDAFNHFRKEEQAEEAAKRVKETLRKYHEEIGE